MTYDIAPINIVANSDGSYYAKNEMTAELPTLGSTLFTFYLLNNEWFLKYGDYPLVKASTGANLLAGIDDTLDLRIVPSDIDYLYVTSDNINKFYVAVGIPD